MSSHQSSESNILEQPGNICNYKFLYQSSEGTIILEQPGFTHDSIMRVLVSSRI